MLHRVLALLAALLCAQLASGRQIDLSNELETYLYWTEQRTKYTTDDISLRYSLTEPNELMLEPIESFYGDLDGRGNTLRLRGSFFRYYRGGTIRDLTIICESCSNPLFGEIAYGSVTLENVRVYGSKLRPFEDTTFDASLAGFFFKSVEGAVTINNCVVGKDPAGRYDTPVSTIDGFETSGGMIGSVASDGQVTIRSSIVNDGCTIKANTAAGGFVGVASGSVTIHNCTSNAAFGPMRNTVDKAGGCVGSVAGRVVIQDTDFEGQFTNARTACGFAFKVSGRLSIKNCYSHISDSSSGVQYVYGFTNWDLDEADNLVSHTNLIGANSDDHFFINVDDFDGHFYAINTRDRIVNRGKHVTYLSDPYLSFDGTVSGDVVNERGDYIGELLNERVKEENYVVCWSKYMYIGYSSPFDRDCLYNRPYNDEIFDRFDFSFLQFIYGLTVLGLQVIAAFLGLTITPCCFAGKCGCCCCACAQRHTGQNNKEEKVEMS